MKNLSLMLISALLLTSCVSTETEETNIPDPIFKKIRSQVIYNQWAVAVQAIEVDGCTYLVADRNGDVEIIHSASCSANHPSIRDE